MTQEFVDTLCETLPGSTRSLIADGELPSWKVGGKMYACYGHGYDGISLKTASADDAALLIEMERAIRAPYFHKSWVRLPWGLVDNDDMAGQILNSYKIIRAGLPRKLQATFAPL
jgi:predicted DNA-binding protein (MmcQ/YjbR family)